MGSDSRARGSWLPMGASWHSRTGTPLLGRGRSKISRGISPTRLRLASSRPTSRVRRLCLPFRWLSDQSQGGLCADRRRRWWRSVCSRTDNAAVESFVSGGASSHLSGHFDALVNCAGVNLATPFQHELSGSLFDTTFDVNLKGTWRLCQLFVEAVMQQNGDKKPRGGYSIVYVRPRIIPTGGMRRV